MKNKSDTHSSSLFLLELVIAIVIFALCSAISLQFFSKAHLWNKESQALHFFSNECSKVAELCSISSSVEDFTKKLSLIYEKENFILGEISLYYDEALQLSSSPASKYCYSILYQEEGEMLKVFMKITDQVQHTTVFELESIHHLGGVPYVS